MSATEDHTKGSLSTQLTLPSDASLELTADRLVRQARADRTVRRGQFTTEQAVKKVLCLTAIERRNTRAHPTLRVNVWKSILNTPAIRYSNHRAVANQQP